MRSWALAWRPCAEQYSLESTVNERAVREPQGREEYLLLEGCDKATSSLDVR
jgi:hypothetical protein